MKMRRVDRQITDINKIKEYLQSAPFMNIAMNQENSCPYIVAVNYGFEIIDNDIILYFHCAKQGRKNDLILKDNNVSVHITSKSDIKGDGKAEDCTTYFSSVYLEGTAENVKDFNEKIHALDRLMINSNFKGDLTYPEHVVNKTAIYKITCKKYTAKSNA